MDTHQRAPALALALIATFAPQIHAQSDTLAITGVTLIDGTGAPPRANMMVLITGDRIVAIAPTRPLQSSARLRVFNGAGGWLIPGLWDVHVHLTKAGQHTLPVFIANGITGVRDLGSDTELLREWQRSTPVAPRIVFAGPMLESPARLERMRRRKVVEPIERYRAAVPDAAAAAAVVDSVARLGATFIKVRTYANTSSYQAIAEATHRRGLRFATHADGVPVQDLLRARPHSIEHPIFPPLQQLSARERADVIAQLKQNATAIVPTMVNYSESIDLPYERLEALVNDSAAARDWRRRFVSGFLLEHWRFQLREKPRGIRARVQDTIADWIYERMLLDLRQMHYAGVRILPGTDVGVIGIFPGFHLHDELAHFVERIGMTAMEALLSATQHAAELVGASDSLGTVAVGKRADLVLLWANPLADIRNTRHIGAVVTRGRLFDRAALDELLGKPRT